MTTTTTGIAELGLAVAPALDKFRAAILAGRLGLDEYRCWAGAIRAYNSEWNARAERITAENRAQLDESARLVRDSQLLITLAPHVGGDVNTGSTHGSSATYTAAQHQERVTAWRRDLAAYLDSIGQPGDTAATQPHPDRVPLAPFPVNPPGSVLPEPLPFSQARDAALDQAARAG